MRRADWLVVASLLLLGGAAARGEEPGARTNGVAIRDPFPLTAAGWGPEAGPGGFASRWAEEYTEAGRKRAILIGSRSSLTLSGELRLRYDSHDNARLSSANDYEQGLMRGVAGASFRFNPNVRVYGELATGQVAGSRSEAAGNMRNDASLQQLFVDGRTFVGSALVGVMAGRQEFADAPRQLMSLGDGSNVHRTWNGVRGYAHGSRVRFGFFDLRATRLACGSFDEDINSAERLRGVNASIALGPRAGDAFLDPFWIRSRNPVLRSAARTGADARDTLGVRLWGRRGSMRYDWTVARQSGRFAADDVDAWGVFAVQSYAIPARAWKPRLTAHVDAASGADSPTTFAGFNPLYASSGYLGEGQFLSLSNLLMIAPGISVTPSARTTVSIEYGLARRLSTGDAVYGGGMKPYLPTRDVPGRDVARLLRVVATWTATDHLGVVVNVEHLSAGPVLVRAGVPSGSYASIATTVRY